MQLRHAIIAAVVAEAASSEVTPIEKVINLISDMKSEVESDGRKEASSYSKFSCFCRDTTASKSKLIQRSTDGINSLSADIADFDATIKEKQSELSDRKKKHNSLNADLDETTARCAKQKAEYQVEEADLSHAIQGLTDAIKAMKDSKPSFLEIKKTLGKTFEMAEAMSMLSTPKHQKVAALLQTSTAVDPSDPDFKFHSDDIIEVCENLLVDYKGNKKTLDDEWAKTDKACKEKKASLNKSLAANEDAMKKLEKGIEKNKNKKAKATENLIEADSTLKDAEQYLKDLTERCEARANDYDQRSAMRNDELTALKSAPGVLKKTVAGRTGERAAMFIQHAKEAAPVEEVAAKAEPILKSVSFLQQLSSSGSKSFLGLTQEARMNKALEVLRQEGNRIGSLALTSLAERSAADPFKKIKGLIQKLIERLLTESKNEATKKGFCDTELGKARKERDFRYQEMTDLSNELEQLEATRDRLSAEIKELKTDIKAESKALKETTEDREEEKADNLKAIKTAKEGLEGLNEALLTLRSFYKQAAKAGFVQIQASPVDEDTAGAGFSGNYAGNQNGMKAVFALLETIQSDFERTLRKTEESENAAHREYVKFSQAAQASIAGKETKQKLNEEDLATTKTNLETKMNDLQSNTDLLDKALQELEELKPTCIDTGMSYSERVKKREEEMEALKKALCILDEDNVEPACNAK